MKNKTKLIIDKYKQDIYTPNLIYVCKNYTNKDITNRFQYYDNTKIEIPEGNDALTYYGVKDKLKNSCILILINKEIFKNKSEYYLEGVAAHEALHAAHRILENIGCYLASDSCEPYAYMVEWITKCILKTMKK